MSVHSDFVTLAWPKNPGNDDIETFTECLETPCLDDRSYRLIRLSNQIEALLIHDAFTAMASAALDVNVGNFSDPPESPGIAHAVEHLLFMGTKKFPIENDYSSYLSMHSGSSNAYTASTSTNYYFEVAAESRCGASDSSPLYGALDRFAQFFIQPLFLSSTLHRELNAVDAEYKRNLQSDAWRLSQLDKTLSNSNHPYHQFSTGNLDTLKILPEAQGLDVRSAVIDFYEKHYSANRMKLVVLGKEPLDTLQEWVTGLFIGIKNKETSPNTWENEQPLNDNHLLTQYFAKPIMDFKALDLYFPFPDEDNLFDSQPSRYVCHLIGHQGPGSIMAYLKSRGWANGLSARAHRISPGTRVFNCQIRLTKGGLNSYQEIVKVFFQYVSLLRETVPQEWIFQEQKIIADVAFKFRQKTPAVNTTCKLSALMQTSVPRQWLLSGDTLRKFNPQAITERLRYLRADNFRISIVSQDLSIDLNQTERWYGTKYRYEKIPMDYLTELKKAEAGKCHLPELHLPRKNQFIPTELHVDRKDVKEPRLAPALIRNDDLIRAWFKKDDTFWVPKANFFISCRSPLVGVTAEHAVKSQIYIELVKDALEEYSYDAEVAGLEYDVSSFLNGLDVQIAGYTDKLPRLLKKVLATLRHLVIDPCRFNVVKDRFAKSLQNWNYQAPYKQVASCSRWLNSERGYSHEQQLEVLPGLNVEDIRSHYPQLFQQMHIETLAHGNMYKEDAHCLTRLVEIILKPKPLEQWPIRRSLVFPPGADYTFHKKLKDLDNVNHCIEYLLYIGERADRTLQSKVLLLEEMMHEAAFDQLRSIEQLGYIVFSGYQATATTFGYHFIIQSEKSPQYLETRIELFLVNYLSHITNLSTTNFENYKRSLIVKQLEKTRNLAEESRRYWQQIESEYFDFDFAQQDSLCTKALTQEEMIAFFKLYICPVSPTRAKLAIHLHAQAKVALSEITGFQSFSGSQAKDYLKEDSGVPANIGTTTNTYVIHNEQDLRSRLPVSAGPKPVKELTEFEERV